MTEDFSTYLAYMVFIIAIFIGLFVLLIRSMRKKRHIGYSGPKAVISGNASVFFDADENVTVISYVKDKYGTGKAAGNPQFLKAPYSVQKLGQTVRTAMSICSSASPCPDSELMNALNYRSWGEFSEGKRNISIYYKEGHGLIFNTTRRMSDGAYSFNYIGFEKIAPGEITDRELGEILKELLKKCRC